MKQIVLKFCNRQCGKLHFFYIAIIICSLVNSIVYAQTKHINGTVTEKGDPLTGVNVVVKGTTNGTITGLNGEYSIEASQGDILVFSFIGYNSKEVKIEDNNLININLEENVTVLQEVVAIGYGTLKSSQVTSSISKVTAEDIDTRPVARIDQAI